MTAKVESGKGAHVRAHASVAAAAIASLLFACGQDHGAGDLGSGDQGTGSGSNGDEAWVVDGTRPALRRLTHDEYRQTVRDLFAPIDVGIDSLTAQFPDEENDDGFSNDSRSLSISPIHFEQYLSAAEGIAARVVTDITKVAPCDPATLDDVACVRTLLPSLGKRTYRRPLQRRGRRSGRALRAGQDGRGRVDRYASF